MSNMRSPQLTQGSNPGHRPFPLTSMALVAEADACLDSIEDIEELTPRQWPQSSRILQEGFAQLLDKWMRHPEHRIRLKCIIALCNFLLDILCILGVNGMTFCIARLHSLSTFFVDYLRIDPHLDMDRMLQNRKGTSAGYRMAGKYLQPFSALLSNVKFRSRHSMQTNMQPCLELLREWEASAPASRCWRASTPMSTCFQCPAVRISCSGQTGITSWQSWPTSGLSACPAPRNQSPAQFQACLSPPRNAMRLTARPSVLRTVMESHGPQLLRVAVLRVEAPRRIRRRSESARVLHRLRAPVGQVLVVLELVGVVLEDPELCGRLLLHVLGRAVRRLVGPRVVGPGRPLKVVAPLPALARHPRGQVLLQRLDAPVHGNGVAVLGPLRAVHGFGQLPVSSVANSLPRSVVTTKFLSSPVSSRAARLVARPTVSAFVGGRAQPGLGSRRSSVSPASACRCVQCSRQRRSGSWRSPPAGSLPQ